MARAPALPLIRLALVLVLTCAMGLSGLAHRFSAPTPQDPSIAAFLAAGGTLADLCGVPLDADHPAGTGRGGCDVCRLVAGMALPVPTPAATRLPTLPRRAWLSPDDRAAPGTDRPNLTCAPRGPPTLI
ncbi:hypothetical protein SAMN04488003_1086 [Loktanella fryxellensis]|uniref:DUF2946 domain-containing protein n=1 Tax=Loktanella fryxellensis TaxID=245187 RepID=A0A1H8D4P9_9RHOB|nr:hypothetical protein [Loktanella fryxellensis]SEN02142.1 hypothetical protein SAMN04488003_1086 [Loktanella fryxellensis]